MRVWFSPSEPRETSRTLPLEQDVALALQAQALVGDLSDLLLDRQELGANGRRLLIEQQGRDLVLKRSVLEGQLREFKSQTRLTLQVLLALNGAVCRSALLLNLRKLRLRFDLLVVEGEPFLTPSPDPAPKRPGPWFR
jgi:hypothetical protein